MPFVAWLAGLLLLVLGSGASVRAQEAILDRRARITDQGRLLISGSVGGNWSNDARGAVGALEQWSVYASPAITYFLRDCAGLGLALSGGASSGANGSLSHRDYSLALGAQGVFELVLGARLGFLVRPFFGYLQQWREQQLTPAFQLGGGSATPAAAQSDIYQRKLGYLRAWLSMHLLFHLSSSVGLSAGPDIWSDFIVVEDGLRAASARSNPVRIQVGLSAGLLIAL